MLIKLRSPKPRSRRLSYLPANYSVVKLSPLPLPQKQDADLFDTLNRRETRRTCGPLSEANLSALLWWSVKTRKRFPEFEHRPVPSAGGIHPIDLIVTNWPAGSSDVYIYDSVEHALGLLGRVQKAASVDLVRHAREVVPMYEATVIWFAAQFGKTLARYKYCESLVWRDAGVLVGALAIVAEALSLSLCPLGVTGDPYLPRALGKKVAGVGGVMVGARLVNE